MSEHPKLQASHLRRQAFVYVRQSTQAQLERNTESTERQYALVQRALELGFRREQVVVIDEDLGISGSGSCERPGFAHLAAEVGLGHAGLVLGLEVSRLARNSADWYRLLDLCGVTDTVIGDGDGLYHPGSFNDRLLLGLKGTMSEAELHTLRARLEGGIRNKAKRGELRRGLPVGLVWGETDGEVLLHPDEAIRGAIAVIFERFAELGSARQVWLWLRREQMKFPLQSSTIGELRWVEPSYHQVHSVLRNPVYAGAYAYGKTRRERYVDEHGTPRTRIRHLPRADWEVLIWEHHAGFIDRETFEANQARLQSNTRPRAHEPGGAVREGAALLQGIAVCGRCARKLKVHYQGRRGRGGPAYHCPGSVLVEGRGQWCLRVGGTQIDQAVADALLAALTPAGVKAALRAAESLEADHDAALAQWRLQVERAQYEAERAERRYRQVEPEHRLVARGLERDWEEALARLAAAEAELSLREHSRPRTLTQAERKRLLALGTDLARVWSAPTTSDRDRKQLLRCLIEEVTLDVVREERRAAVTVRWQGGALTELAVALPRPQPAIRTNEDTIELLERLAAHYPDATIAGILNRQGRRSATGERFTAIIVGGLRRYRNIPAYQPPADPPDGELLPIAKAAEVLGVATSTVHRWLSAGFIAGEQDTPGAPWRIRVNDELRALFVEDPPPGYVPIVDAMRILGVSRQTVLQRVKRGELEAIHVRNGRRKGLRIRIPEPESALFDAGTMNAVAV
ncbi:MAG: recombinase family protein [Actinobacteria bacterium]|nr:recombinase family protein [Actinomycetota bacterium]MCA1697518.1 recombinase family protein [Actinomycetota bacterium]